MCRRKSGKRESRSCFPRSIWMTAGICGYARFPEECAAGLAILHDPQVLIVDEPTAGLDPEERVRFRNLLCEIATDRIVLLSTHIVEDIEKTCKNIAVLNEGRIVYNGTLADYIGDEDGLETAYMKKMGGLH